MEFNNSSRKKRKKSMLLLMIVIFTLVILISGGIYFGIQNTNSNMDGFKDDIINNLRYRLEININDRANYTIWIPIPVGWDNLYNIVHVTEGRASINNCTIDNDPCLQVKANESVLIIAEEKINGHRDIHYNVSNDNGMIKVYCYREPAMVAMSLSNIFIKSIGGTARIESGNLTQGWQYLELKV